MATTIKLKNVDQIIGHLLSIGTACTFVSCITATPQDDKLRKACPWRGKGLVKVCRRTGWLNMDYNRAVRRRIAVRLDVPFKDVEYTNGECWHSHVLTGENKLTPVCFNKHRLDSEKRYIFLTQGTVSRVSYRLPSGEEIPYDQLKDWFHASGEKDDLKPTVRTVTLNHVSEIRVRGLIVRTPSTEKNEQLLAA